MPETRLPKQLLTAWLPQKRPVGRPELTYTGRRWCGRYAQSKRLEDWHIQQQQWRQRQQQWQQQLQQRRWT
jgi:hypothetical protein